MNTDHGLRNTTERFYAAAQAVLQGDVVPMRAVWLHSDEASYCDTRGEFVIGWPSLEAYWRQAASSNAASTAKLTATGQIQYAVATADLAYVVALEEVRQLGASSVMRTRATNVFRRDANGGWRLLHRHADAAPKVNEQEWA
jgi:ketosteroid isomerase-like protein